MNNIINSSGVYDINTYNLTSNKATILFTLNMGGYLIGSGSGLTNLVYDNITNKLVLATTANLNNLSTNSTLSINNLNATSKTIFTNLNFLNNLSRCLGMDPLARVVCHNQPVQNFRIPLCITPTIVFMEYSARCIQNYTLASIQAATAQPC
jgi:hypothetical protein